MKHRPHFLHRHPWLYVAFAFLLLIAAWSSLITITLKFRPQTIEVPSANR
jgi:hypothetical protein